MFIINMYKNHHLNQLNINFIHFYYEFINNINN